MALTIQRRAFVEYYLQLWQGDKAAIAAGYSAKSARSKASSILADPEVKALIEERLLEFKMGANEVLTRLTEQGRASLGDFFDEFGKLNWTYIKEHGHLIKSIAETKHGYRIELYDGQNALIHMGKAAGLFAERHEISGTLAMKLYDNVSPDDWDTKPDDTAA